MAAKHSNRIWAASRRRRLNNHSPHPLLTSLFTKKNSIIIINHLAQSQALKPKTIHTW